MIKKNAVAEEITGRITSNQIHAFVPPLFHLEVSNALVVAYRRKRIGHEDVLTYLGLVKELPVIVDNQMNMLTYTKLALEYSLSTYDAAYLELANRKRYPLMTLDKSLYEAAKSLRIAYGA